MYDKEWFKQVHGNQVLQKKLQKIKLIITDVDGCLTDGKVYYSAHDEIQKGFSIQDGFAMTKCNKTNMPAIAVITGRIDKAATQRMHKLAIPDDLYYQGVDKNKTNAVLELQQKHGYISQETLFFGDDFLDLETKSAISLFACPLNAIFYVQHQADLQIPRSGGDGAFRLLLDLVLYVQKKHFAQEFITESLQ